MVVACPSGAAGAEPQDGCFFIPTLYGSPWAAASLLPSPLLGFWIRQEATAFEHLNHIWGCSDSFSASAAVSCPHLAMYDDFCCSLATLSLNPG